MRERIRFYVTLVQRDREGFPIEGDPFFIICYGYCFVKSFIKKHNICIFFVVVPMESSNVNQSTSGVGIQFSFKPPYIHNWSICTAAQPTHTLFYLDGCSLLHRWTAGKTTVTVRAKV